MNTYQCQGFSLRVPQRYTIQPLCEIERVPFGELSINPNFIPLFLVVLRSYRLHLTISFKTVKWPPRVLIGASTTQPEDIRLLHIRKELLWIFSTEQGHFWSLQSVGWVPHWLAALLRDRRYSYCGCWYNWISLSTSIVLPLNNPTMLDISCPVVSWAV